MIRTLAAVMALIGLAFAVLTLAPTIGPPRQDEPKQIPAADEDPGTGPSPQRIEDRATRGDDAAKSPNGTGAAGAASDALSNVGSEGTLRSDRADRADRNVTPDGMTRGPGGLANLKRVAPRGPQWAPPSSLAATAAQNRPNETPQPAVENGPLPIRQQLLPRPVALDAAHLKIGESTIALPGIEALALDAECGEGDGAWPCGMRARTAFRSFLRSRSIRCAAPTDFLSKSQTVSTDCTIGGGDIGAWLIQNGWAKATPDGPYVDREARARKARRGVWGPAPSLRGRDMPDRETAQTAAGTDRPPAPPSTAASGPLTPADPTEPASRTAVAAPASP